MKKIGEGITAIIGQTPLVSLKQVIDRPFHLYGKMEGLNPSGSIKDRPALEIIRYGIESGVIHDNTVIIEASSGNMGLGLAQICRYLGLRFICVTDTKATPQNLRLLQTYGAEVEVVTEPDPVTKEFLQARINRVHQIYESLDDAFWVNQYSNLLNAQAHYCTMEEIVTALNGRVDYLFCAASSCGTLRGCAEYVKSNKLSTKIWAVDAAGSVIFGGLPGKRLIPGHGAGIRPALYTDSLAERCIKITDWDCVVGCRRLLEKEGLLLGGSSGAAFMAVDQVKEEILPGTNCVVIFPDRGERYLDTIFDDQWVEKHWPGGALELRKLQGVSQSEALSPAYQAEEYPEERVRMAVT
jgi:2,3-diaminopropionate biosynthesis protein SbnA